MSRRVPDGRRAIAEYGLAFQQANPGLGQGGMAAKEAITAAQAAIR